MYWLITYSQFGTAGNRITANSCTMHIHPSDWLVAMINKSPETGTILLFAIEISKSQFEDLNEII